jgi:predicted nucleic acid-binding Zn ribbon protein
VSTHCVKCGAILIKSNEKTCSPNCIHNDQHRSYVKTAELAIMNIEYEIQQVAERYVDSRPYQ